MKFILTILLLCVTLHEVQSFKLPAKFCPPAEKAGEMLLVGLMQCAEHMLVPNEPNGPVAKKAFAMIKAKETKLSDKIVGALLGKIGCPIPKRRLRFGSGKLKALKKKAEAARNKAAHKVAAAKAAAKARKDAIKKTALEHANALKAAKAKALAKVAEAKKKVKAQKSKALAKVAAAKAKAHKIAEAKKLKLTAIANAKIAKAKKLANAQKDKVMKKALAQKKKAMAKVNAKKQKVLDKVKAQKSKVLAKVGSKNLKILGKYKAKAAAIMAKACFVIEKACNPACKAAVMSVSVFAAEYGIPTGCIKSAMVKGCVKACGAICNNKKVNAMKKKIGIAESK